MRVALVAVLLAMLAGCGSSGHAPGLGDTPVALANGQPLLTCDDRTTFPVSAMRDGVEARIDRPGITLALGKSPYYKDDVAARVPSLVEGDVQWNALVASPRHVLAAVGPWSDHGPGKGAGIVDLSKHGHHWEWEGFGQCHPRPALGVGLEWLDLAIRSGSFAASSAKVAVDVEETGCTSGRDVSDFVRKPVVLETARTITLYWTAISPPAGAYTCLGTVDSYDRRIVTLRHALGHRVVRDGSYWPPKVLARPLARHTHAPWTPASSSSRD